VPGSTPAFLPRLSVPVLPELGRFLLTNDIHLTGDCGVVQKRCLARECTALLGKKLPVLVKPLERTAIGMA
jgi:hypothetical protein